MNYKITTDTDAAKWHLIFTLLSLDMTIPFMRDMGIELNDFEALQKILRSFVRAYRKIENNNSLDVNIRLVLNQQLYQETMDKISRQLSSPLTASNIYEWGEVTFRYGDELNSQVFLWARILRRLADITNIAFPCAPLHLAPEKKQKVCEVILKYLDQPYDLETRIRAAENNPKSAWDELICKAYNDGSLMDWVVNTVEFVSFKRCWQEIEKILSPLEFVVLLDWAKRQAAIMEMPKEAIELVCFS